MALPFKKDDLPNLIKALNELGANDQATATLPSEVIGLLNSPEDDRLMSWLAVLEFPGRSADRSLLNSNGVDWNKWLNIWAGVPVLATRSIPKSISTRRKAAKTASAKTSSKKSVPSKGTKKKGTKKTAAKKTAVKKTVSKKTAGTKATPKKRVAKKTSRKKGKPS